MDDLDEANAEFRRLATEALSTSAPTPPASASDTPTCATGRSAKSSVRCVRRYYAIRAASRLRPSQCLDFQLQQVCQAYNTARKEWNMPETRPWPRHRRTFSPKLRGALPSYDFFTQYRRARGVKKSNSRDLPFLNPKRAVTFWQDVY